MTQEDQTPTPFTEGQKARRDGKPLKENPYRQEQAAEHMFWRRGWAYEANNAPVRTEEQSILEPVVLWELGHDHPGLVNVRLSSSHTILDVFPHEGTVYLLTAHGEGPQDRCNIHAFWVLRPNSPVPEGGKYWKTFVVGEIAIMCVFRQ